MKAPSGATNKLDAHQAAGAACSDDAHHAVNNIHFHSRNAVSQRVAHTSSPSLVSAVIARRVIWENASALALLTAEPAVLWSCHHLDAKEVVEHFKKRAQIAKLRRDGLFPMETWFRCQLFERQIQLGLDGSILNDGMTVYVPDWTSMGFLHPRQELDYFYGMYEGHAMAQTMEDEWVLSDMEMLNPHVGFVALRIRKIQKLFRSRHH